MSNRETNESGSFKFYTLALLAVVVCTVALLLMPAHANTESSESADVTYAAAGDAGYLPAQVVNQGKDAEPVVDMSY